MKVQTSGRLVSVTGRSRCRHTGDSRSFWKYSTSRRTIAMVQVAAHHREDTVQSREGAVPDTRELTFPLRLLEIVSSRKGAITREQVVPGVQVEAGSSVYRAPGNSMFHHRVRKNKRAAIGADTRETVCSPRSILLPESSKSGSSRWRRPGNSRFFPDTRKAVAAVTRERVVPELQDTA